MQDETILQRLRARGHRLTPQRQVIYQVIEAAQGHLSAGEVFDRAILLLPGLTEPTVYRTLDFLTQNGLALVTHVGDGRLVYESAAYNHHHLICRACGASVEIDAGMLDSLRDVIHTRTGFLVDCSHVTFSGLCPGCR